MVIGTLHKEGRNLVRKAHGLAEKGEDVDSDGCGSNKGG